MTRDDLQVLCTALGFMVVVMKGEAEDKQASRAKAFAKLIESFCLVTVPEALGAANIALDDSASIAQIDLTIDRYKAELIDSESASLSFDRDVLIKIYDRLMLRQIRRQQRAFYEKGTGDMIANQILNLVTEEIEAEQRAA